MSLVVGQNSLASYREQNSPTLQGNTKLNFRLAHDQVLLLKTTANLSKKASRCQAIYFIAFFLFLSWVV